VAQAVAVAEEPVDPFVDESPRPHVLRLVLQPDELRRGGVPVEHVDELWLRPGVELLEADHRGERSRCPGGDERVASGDRGAGDLT